MNGFDKIPEERKRRLDALFEAFSVIGDDTYVYLCDMHVETVVLLTKTSVSEG